MNNNPINTNISEIPKTKSIFFDTSRNNNNIINNFSLKMRPITSRITLKPKKIKKINFTPKSPKPSHFGFNTKLNPKLFSLNDIKDQFYSKAPNLPNQYKRIIYNNINNLLYNKNKRGFIFQIPQIDYGINKTSTIPDNNILKKNKSDLDIDKLVLTMSRKERLFKPHFWDNAPFEEIKKSQRDKLMPKGYEFYEKNFKENNKKNFIKNNYTKIKENKKNTKDSILIRKLNQIRQHKSDIFFFDEKNNILNKKNENSKEKKRILYKKYLDSDIFNLRQDKNIIEKSGEHSFLQENNIKKTIYNSNNETLLGWKLRRPLPSFLNYTSSQYSLFNRDMKNNGKTKENIINEVKNIDKSFNPTHKQKGLGEFIELIRVSAPNINVDYNKAITNDPNIFKKKNNFSTEFFDIYGHYNNICEKPFQKFSIIK